jgi:predicted house-cleaning noncanonical NTP pyrophosphatase (MazG superfamily)
MDGGNFSNNSTTVFLTNKLLEDNRELSKSEIVNMLQDFTSLRPEIIERSKTDTIGHTDGFINFIAEDKVLLSNYPSLLFLKSDIDFLYRIRKKLEEEKLEVIDLYDRPLMKLYPVNVIARIKKPAFIQQEVII